VRKLLHTPPEVVAVLCSLVVVNQALMAWRFLLAFEQAGGRGVSFFKWLQLTCVGQFLNLFVPQLGNVYRGMALKREHSVSYTAYASILFAYVWLDLLMGVTIAFTVIAVFDAGLKLAGVAVLFWLLLVIAALFGAPILAGRMLRRVRASGVRLALLRERLAALLAATQTGLKNPVFLGRVLIVNVFSTAGQVATYWFCFRVVGSSISLSALIVFQVFAKLSNLVIITPGNLGLNELAIGVLSRASNQTLEQGIAVSLLVRAVSTAMQILLGLLGGGGALLVAGRRGIEGKRN
jgi:uncharacterized protein (TIRG00374 family)